MANGAGRVDLDGRPIKPITICMIGAGGFIGSHLCEKLMTETPHTVLALDVYDDEKINALDGYDDKIKHLLEPVKWKVRIQFHRINIKDDSRLKEFMKMADLTINLAATCFPADYNTPRVTIYSNFIDALPVDPSFYLLKEDISPCIFGSIEKQRWSYACAEQLIERLIYGEGDKNGLEFTIVRPFNWIGPKMDFSIDGPSKGVLACFSYNLLRGEPLKLVDGGESQRTFIYINDAIEAVLLMIENPERANGHIFNVGNPSNKVTVRQLAIMMTEVYSKVSGEGAIKNPTVDVSSINDGYDDSDKRIPDMTIINRQIGWYAKTTLWDLLESTLIYLHKTYSSLVLALQVEENKKKLEKNRIKNQEAKKKKAETRGAVVSREKREHRHNATKANVSNRKKNTGGGRNVCIDDDF